MSQAQWGHGFHAGEAQGANAAFEYINSLPDASWAVERVNLLLFTLNAVQGQPEAYLVARMISEAIQPFLTGKAWHEIFDEREKTVQEWRKKVIEDAKKSV